MTYKHECRNCHWSVRKYKGMLCACLNSGRTNVNEKDWCMKWEAEDEQQLERVQGLQNVLREE